VPISAAEPLLSVAGLKAGYGKVRVLDGVDLSIAPGEVLALLGPNGAGKTTFLRAISGLLTPEMGEIRFAGTDMTDGGPRRAMAAGMAHVIEGHRVFTQLPVFDNLLLAGYHLPRTLRQQRAEAAIAWFPEIDEKRHQLAGALSGGQQQMLAVAQGLVTSPRLLLLDEPSAGLSPVLVDRVLQTVARLREEGTAVILVEQLIDKALAVADRVVAMVRGRLVFESAAQAPGVHTALERAYLGHHA
jgi:branched-chain amino acid transport system ATP-binding protein